MRKEYKKSAYPANMALFTRNRPGKTSSAMVNRTKNWGIAFTGALVAFVFVASYGLGQVCCLLDFFRTSGWA